MSKPTNSAARNQMREFERQCYDWGWQDNEDRIIKLLKSNEWSMLCRQGRSCNDKDRLGYCDCKGLLAALKGKAK